MKKILLSSFVLSGILFANQLSYIPLNKSNLSNENGGEKTAIEAYSDGIGIYTAGKFEIDNKAMNELVFSHGETAKKEGKTLKEYVLENGSNKEKELAEKLGNLAENIIPVDGTSCDDKNEYTENDVYINGICKGEIKEYLSYLNDNNKYTLSELKNITQSSNKLFISGKGYLTPTSLGAIFDNKIETSCYYCGFYFSKHIETNNEKSYIMFEIKEIGRIWSSPTDTTSYDSDINLFKKEGENWINISNLLYSVKGKRTFNYFNLNSDWLEPGIYKAERKDNSFSTALPTSTYEGLRTDSEWYIEKPYNIN
jgi:hypothetical protein